MYCALFFTLEECVDEPPGAGVFAVVLESVERQQ
jgi:hypothetical protein